MKTILVATDYSEISQNATRYAAALAKQVHAKIILYHGFYFQETFSDVLQVVPTLRELTKEHQAKLAKLSKHITQTYQIPVTSFTSQKPVVEELPRLVKKYGADLVVMGIKSLNTFDRKVFGSMATAVLNLTLFPVLLVPQEATFDPYHHILFPYDFHAIDLKNKFPLLKDLASLFHSQIVLLHVEQREPEMVIADKGNSTKKYTQLENILQEVKHAYMFVEGEDIAEGISKVIHQYKADLMVMVPQKHGFWDRLMDSSVIHKMAFRTHIPLLSLPNPS